MDKKGLDYDGFRSLAVWLMDKITGLWAGERESLDNYVQQTQDTYKGAVFLTQAEYDALSDEQKMDGTKVYFIMEE